MAKKKLPDAHLYLESLLPFAENIRKERRFSEKDMMIIIIELFAERELSAIELLVLLLRSKDPCIFVISVLCAITDFYNRNILQIGFIPSRNILQNVQLFKPISF